MSRDRAIEILEADRALTGRQLYVYHSIHPKLLTNLGRRDVTLAPRKNWSDAPVTARFYGLNQRDLDRLHPAACGHYAGIAGLRHRLQVGPASWHHLRAGGQDRIRGLEPGCVPDAWYQGAGGRVAVEYDTGTYSMGLVEEKMLEYQQDYSLIVWGATSDIRRARLKSLASELYVRASVMDATWWTA